MTKQEFIAKLREQLSDLPKNDVEEHIGFYSEMIDDRIEDGFSEDNAIKDIGAVEEVASQILSKIPLTRIVKEKIKPKRRISGLEIALLAIGAPVWISLAAAAFAVILSLYVSLWAVIISFWAVFVSFGAGTVGGVAVGIGYIISGSVSAGLVLFGAGIACAGLFIFSYAGCKAATKGGVSLLKLILLSVKKSLIKKREG